MDKAGSVNLQGKNAIITGGGRGIGRGIALTLARAGCNIALTYVRKRSDAEETVAAAMELGVQACALKANLAHVEEAGQVVQAAVEHLGGVDIFVANAASGVLKPITAVAAKDWEWTVNINARSILTGVQAAVPHMRVNGWGRIITITSPGSRSVYPGYSMVGISKAAAESMTRYLAAELAPEGIVANCVCPGLVITGALEFFPEKEEMIEQVRQHTPAGRLVTPEDVGNVVAWLCTDQAGMIVGQTLEVDGGYGLMMLR